MRSIGHHPFNNRLIITLASFVVITVSFILFIGSKNGSSSSIFDHTVLEKQLIGVWQDMPSMAAGWSNRYHFYDNGTYSFVTSEMDCASNLRQQDGNWKIDGSKLVMRPYSQLAWNGGNLVPALGTCGTPKELVNYTIVISSVDNNCGKNCSPLHNGVEIKFVNDNSIQPPKMSVNLADKKFWKFYDSPDKDAPAPIGSNVKADDYFFNGFFDRPDYSLKLTDDFSLTTLSDSSWELNSDTSQLIIKEFPLQDNISSILSTAPSNVGPAVNITKTSIKNFNVTKASFWLLDPDKSEIPSLGYIIKLPKLQLFIYYRNYITADNWLEQLVLPTLEIK